MGNMRLGPRALGDCAQSLSPRNKPGCGSRLARACDASSRAWASWNAVLAASFHSGHRVAGTVHAARSSSNSSSTRSILLLSDSLSMVETPGGGDRPKSEDQPPCNYGFRLNATTLPALKPSKRYGPRRAASVAGCTKPPTSHGTRIRTAAPHCLRGFSCAPQRPAPRWAADSTQARRRLATAVSPSRCCRPPN
jgi:hypothetical protein